MLECWSNGVMDCWSNVVSHGCSNPYSDSKKPINPKIQYSNTPFSEGGVDMLVVGLTGGIGCGKSEVRRRLLNAGFIVLDADTLAKQLSDADPVIIRKIKAEFGEAMYDAAGHLQRKALAAIVFNDRKQLEKLNGIVHPRVISTVERQIMELQDRGEKIVIVEAALHYEVHWDEAMDVMVVVNAPLEERLARVMQRDGVEEAAVRRRMARQIPLEEKVKRADYVIENSGDLATLDGEVARLIEWLKMKSEGEKPRAESGES